MNIFYWVVVAALAGVAILQVLIIGFEINDLQVLASAPPFYFKIRDISYVLLVVFVVFIGLGGWRQSRPGT